VADLGGWLGWQVTPPPARQPVSCYYYVCDLSYFDVVLCPSSNEIMAISFSRKPRPPQCSIASLGRVPKVTPSKNPRSANAQLDRGRFVYDTHRTMKATRSRHGWVHMFITHRPTVTLQLHNFDLFTTCRTSSFCTVAWQVARFQLTRRIERSLGDSWASCLR